ncbi:hypothetical protein Nepgr_009737 [Nepenthes gracilis]|uniref:PUM-HD domain-containing protein n=1 Tax=Nepenthes gracilis TaxID=150966 RepID=A0AAD3SBA2_NEPGR|nr:hypothetical protein Nepgr_009737 [Nepenthes gracilis]
MPNCLRQPLMDRSRLEELIFPSNYPGLFQKERILEDPNVSTPPSDGQVNFPKSTTANLCSEANLLGTEFMKEVKFEHQSSFQYKCSSGDQSNNTSGKHIQPEHHTFEKELYYLHYLQRTSDNGRQYQQQMLCWRSSGTIKPGVFEFSDIVDHVVKFRKDFTEIIPHAHILATDVFGNYVIQKALEVVDVEEKIWIVAEFDGLVMKCVHDQNDNHVIQKCIECIPEDRILFIISAFCGQVFALSTHPYGCRVIQRVIQHGKP